MHLVRDLVAAAVCCCGCGVGEVETPGVATAPPAEVSATSDSGLIAARQAGASRDYEGAVDAYLALELSEPSLLVERGRYLLTVARFHRGLAHLGRAIQGDMLTGLEESFRENGIHSDVVRPMRVALEVQRHRWLPALEVMEAALASGVTGPWLPRAQLAAARAELELGNRAEAERLTGLAAESHADDPAIRVAVHRARVEMGLVPADTQVATDALSRVAGGGSLNLALVDGAAVFLAAGLPLRAHGLLRRYEPALPEARERVGPEASREFHDLQFISLLSNSLLRLAAEDLSGALADLADARTRVVAAHGLGVALSLLGDEEEARRVRRVAAETPRADLPPYVAYLADVCRAMAKGDSPAIAREADGAAGRQEALPHGSEDEMRAMALGATESEFRARERGASDLLERCLDRGIRIMGSRPQRHSLARAYWAEAGVLTARVLRQGERLHREQAVRVLERVHESSGYHPKDVDPGFLVELAHAYYVHDDDMSRTVLASLVAHYREARPVFETMQVLVSLGTGKLDPGRVVPDEK